MNANHFVTRPAFLAAIAALVVIVLPHSSARAPLVPDLDYVGCGGDAPLVTISLGEFVDGGPYANKAAAMAAAVNPDVIADLGMRLNCAPFEYTVCENCSGTGCIGAPFTVDDTDAGLQASVYQDATGQWWVRMTVVGEWLMSYECTPCVPGTD